MGTSVNSRVKDLLLMYVSFRVFFQIKNKGRDKKNNQENKMKEKSKS